MLVIGIYTKSLTTLHTKFIYNANTDTHYEYAITATQYKVST